MMMVTRNMAEGNASLLYPAIDYTGEQLGVIGMEFPLFNYFNAKIIDVFGYSHWYGRLMNLIFSSFGIYIFFLLVEKISGRKIAFYSTLALLAGLWFGYARKIMPDTFSASFLIAGMYCLLLFIDSEHRYKSVYLLAGGIAVAIAGLTKVSSLAGLSFLAPHMLNRLYSIKNKSIVALTVASACCITLYWYFAWVPYLNTLSPARFFMGNGFSVSMQQILTNPWGIANRFVVTALGISGFLAVLIGGYISCKNKDIDFILVSALGFVAETLFILKAGDHFAIHSYYIVPFVPVLAYMAGYGIARLPKRYAFVFLIIMVMENSARQYGEFIIRSKNASIEFLADTLTNHGVARDALIAINSYADPTILYFSGRKGWLPPNGQMQDSSFQKSIINKGCTHFLLLKNKPKLQQEHLGTLVYENDLLKVFSLPATND